MLKRVLLISLCVMISISVSMAAKQEAQSDSNEHICAVYFSGKGCGHCARVGSLVVADLLEDNKKLIFIKYEINETSENASVIGEYNTKYRNGYSIPQIIFSDNYKEAGEEFIFSNFQSLPEELKDGNECPLIDSPDSFKDLDVNSLPGKPQIWLHDRVLYKKSKGKVDSETLRKLLLTDDIEKALDNVEYKRISPQEYDFKDLTVKFKNAVKIGGWLFQWSKELETTQKK